MACRKRPARSLQYPDEASIAEARCRAFLPHAAHLWSTVGHEHKETVWACFRRCPGK